MPEVRAKNLMSLVMLSDVLQYLETQPRLETALSVPWSCESVSRSWPWPRPNCLGLALQEQDSWIFQKSQLVFKISLGLCLAIYCPGPIPANAVSK